MHDSDFRAIGARYPDATRAVERIVRPAGHVNVLPEPPGARVDAGQRRLPIDYQPDAVRAGGDAAFPIRRANPGHERHLASIQIHAREHVRLGTKRDPDTPMSDRKSSTRISDRKSVV